MYFVIESSPTGDRVVGNFSTQAEAEKMINILVFEANNSIPIGVCYCDYYVTKIVMTY